MAQRADTIALVRRLKMLWFTLWLSALFWKAAQSVIPFLWCAYHHIDSVFVAYASVS